PLGVNKFVAAVDILRRDRFAANPGIAREQSLDLVLALFRFQRADAVNERCTRLEQPYSLVEQSLLQGREQRDVGFALEPWHVRMTAYRTRRRTGRIKQHCIKGLVLPFQCVSRDSLGMEGDAREIFAQTIEPSRRAIDG